MNSLDAPQLELQQNNEAHPHPVLAHAQRLYAGWTRIEAGQANCSECLHRLTPRTATWWLVPPDRPERACGVCDDHALSIALKIRRGNRQRAMAVPRSRRA